MTLLYSFLLTGLLTYLASRALWKPLRWMLGLGVHAGTGLGCLWILNRVSDITGLILPVNPISVVLAGFGGIPGIGVLALLELF